MDTNIYHPLPAIPTPKQLQQAAAAASKLPEAQRMDIDAVMRAVYAAFVSNAPLVVLESPIIKVTTDPDSANWRLVVDTLDHAVPGWERNANDIDLAVVACHRIRALAEAAHHKDGELLKTAANVLRTTGEVFAVNREHVDAWALQHEVMTLSGQDTPTDVRITPQVVLYQALQTEETGETALALADAITNGYMPRVPYVVQVEPDGLNRDLATANRETAWSDANAYMRCCEDLRETAAFCKKQAASLRQLIAVSFGTRMPGFAITLHDAKELADGFSDTIVVSAGGLISAGMPGAPLYHATTMSNITKANPVTGVIDKQPDGKWIKGPDWVKPDFDAILAPVLWDGGRPGWSENIIATRAAELALYPDHLDGTV